MGTRDIEVGSCRGAKTACGLRFSRVSLQATLAFKAATGIGAPWPASVASLVIVVLARALPIKKVKV